ncbi:helix-turn-helix domain-containing protein, partial [Rhizobium hidalgonense]
MRQIVGLAAELEPVSIKNLPCMGGLDDSPRGKILRVAAYLFQQQGYTRTTVRDIATMVGIQSGSLFHHFKSKD